MNAAEKRIAYGSAVGALQALMDVLIARGIPTYGAVIAINIGDDGLLVVGGAPGDPLERARLMGDLHRDAPAAIAHWAEQATAASIPAGEIPRDPFAKATASPPIWPAFVWEDPTDAMRGDRPMAKVLRTILNGQEFALGIAEDTPQERETAEQILKLRAAAGEP